MLIMKLVSDTFKAVQTHLLLGRTSRSVFNNASGALHCNKIQIENPA
jgi:hypothetical protein